MAYRIGIDVGGTFTDFLLVDESGAAEFYKVPSTPDDPSRGVIDGLGQMAERRGLTLAQFAGQVGLVVHGTTVATNAVLTGRGAQVGLLTTEGFRDVLQMRRGGVKEDRLLYDNKHQPPRPVVPRERRVPIAERVRHDGAIVTPIDEGQVAGAVDRLRRAGTEAFAVCFMHGYANPAHEQAAARIIRQQCPDAYVSVSSELLPQIRMYDRVSTTALNAFVGPIVQRYLTNLVRKLDGVGFGGNLLIMQSNGGVANPTVAAERAATTLLSGPAAGPIAGATYAALHGHRDCITIDMGGTSFDAALVKDGTPFVVTDGHVARYLVALPMLAINTIGAGGGSIGWINDGGLLQMGPQSAGAVPGPACYGAGGERPTCTDADLVLGLVNEDYFLGGRIRLHRDRAEEAIREHVAKPLGLDLPTAAAGMFRVINTNMAAGIKEISVDRGYDPRDFPLVVAGGAGPVHAAMIALELEIPTIIVPRESAIFCAAGMLLSDLKYDFVRAYPCRLAVVDQDRVCGLVHGMEREATQLLAAARVSPGALALIHAADLRYVGQYHEVTVRFGAARLATDTVDDVLAPAFHQAHEHLYGYALPERPLELINLRLTATARTPKPTFPERPPRGPDASAALKGRRAVYLARSGAFQEVPVYDGDRLESGNHIPGPAVVEQPATTTFVPPEYELRCDAWGNFVMRLRG